MAKNTWINKCRLCNKRFRSESVYEQKYCDDCVTEVELRDGITYIRRTNGLTRWVEARRGDRLLHCTAGNYSFDDVEAMVKGLYKRTKLHFHTYAAQRKFVEENALSQDEYIFISTGCLIIIERTETTVQWENNGYVYSAEVL